MAPSLARSMLARRWSVASPGDLAVATVVVAPHPDDETLGCGALIAAKRRLGAEVAVVFLTDGAASHPRIGAPRLRAMRRDEALAACSVLGVAEDAVTFLCLPDGALAHHLDAATGSMRAILAERRPLEVFVTSGIEPHPDHRAAFRAVAAAAQATDPPPRVRQYPVWLWNHWPWVAWADLTFDRHRRFTPGLWRRSLTLLPEWRAFDWVVPIGELETTKRDALSRHASQVDRLDGSEDWPTLGAVSGGRFIDCFFAGVEPFTGGAGSG